MNHRLIKFKINGDERGSLISLEQKRNIPFTIRRVYYIYGTKEDIVRGKHAHPELEQVAVCVHGSCKFLLDDGVNKETLVLNDPSIGLYIGKNLWREMYDFSNDCVLMVLASDYYNEEEYIRDYQNFLTFIKK